MNILTTTDNNRHRIEGQTLQEKKQKKSPPHEKILLSTHKTHFHFFCLSQSQPKKKMKECFPQRFVNNSQLQLISLKYY
jgi:hypothetical protein